MRIRRQAEDFMTASNSSNWLAYTHLDLERSRQTPDMGYHIFKWL